MPKALKSCPKSNKSPNLVTLISDHYFCAVIWQWGFYGVGFLNGPPQPLFVLFKHKFYRNNFGLQPYSNMDCQDRRRACWPLDHHHTDPHRSSLNLLTKRFDSPPSLFASAFVFIWLKNSIYLSLGVLRFTGWQHWRLRSIYSGSHPDSRSIDSN